MSRSEINGSLSQTQLDKGGRGSGGEEKEKGIDYQADGGPHHGALYGWEKGSLGLGNKLSWRKGGLFRGSDGWVDQ